MAVKKLKRKEKPTSNNLTEMTNKQLEFLQVKVQQKLLKSREESLKNELSEYMANTIKPSSKGHFLFTTLDENGNKIHLQRQARKKISLNQEKAIEYLTEWRRDLVIDTDAIAKEVTNDQIIEVLLKHAPHFMEKVSVIDEAGLEQAVLNEEIQMEDFEALCKIDITYAMTFVDDKKLEIEEGD